MNHNFIMLGGDLCALEQKLKGPVHPVQDAVARVPPWSQAWGRGLTSCGLGFSAVTADPINKMDL